MHLCNVPSDSAHVGCGAFLDGSCLNHSYQFLVAKETDGFYSNTSGHCSSNKVAGYRTAQEPSFKYWTTEWTVGRPRVNESDSIEALWVDSLELVDLVLIDLVACGRLFSKPIILLMLELDCLRCWSRR